MAVLGEKRMGGHLIPRFTDQGYDRDQVADRRRWVEDKTNADLQHVSKHTLDSAEWRGNIENPIGTVQMPLGVAGPLEVHGEHAQGTFYVPLATTEGALVRSYERGARAITRAGGAQVRVYVDENRICPVFFFDDVKSAYEFSKKVEANIDGIRAAAESTTRHGKLLRVECIPIGRELILNFCYYTADAQGMNMISTATDAGCKYICEQLGGPRYYIFSGYNSEKRASGSILRGGKGKKVTAGVLIPERVAKGVLHASPQQLFNMWQHTLLGHVQTGAIGYNGHYANGLTALFIATGQDVANVANSAVGVTNFELTDDGDLYASVTLASLSVATVGGGTGIGTSRECLQMLGCAGSGNALKLAEIAAAAVLGGELSMGGAIASGEFVAAHESYGRNRPTGE